MQAKDLILSSMVDALSGTTPLFLSGPLPRVLPPACGQMLKVLTAEYVDAPALDWCQ